MTVVRIQYHSYDVFILDLYLNNFLQEVVKFLVLFVLFTEKCVQLIVALADLAVL